MRTPTFKEIREAKNQLQELNKLVAACPHELGCTDYGSAVCLHCDRRFGWWCPASPTHKCNYKQPDGTYNEDNCTYCHNPDERK